MKKIIKGDRTLVEFHCEVNKALNLALTKYDNVNLHSDVPEYNNNRHYNMQH